MLVMEPLEVLTLALESCIARKPLAAKKLFVIGVIEALDNAVSPRFSNGNKHRCNPIIKA
jgi:hypothetical protein